MTKFGPLVILLIISSELLFLVAGCVLTAHGHPHVGLCIIVGAIMHLSTFYLGWRILLDLHEQNRQDSLQQSS